MRANPQSFHLLSELKETDVTLLLAGDYLPYHKAHHRYHLYMTNTNVSRTQTQIISFLQSCIECQSPEKNILCKV